VGLRVKRKVYKLLVYSSMKGERRVSQHGICSNTYIDHYKHGLESKYMVFHASVITLNPLSKYNDKCVIVAAQCYSKTKQSDQHFNLQL